MTTKWIASLAKAASNGTETTKKSSSLRQQSNGDNATTRECAAVVFAFFSLSFILFSIRNQRTTENNGKCAKSALFFCLWLCESFFFVFTRWSRESLLLSFVVVDGFITDIFVCRTVHTKREELYEKMHIQVFAYVLKTKNGAVSQLSFFVRFQVRVCVRAYIFFKSNAPGFFYSLPISLHLMFGTYMRDFSPHICA